MEVCCMTFPRNNWRFSLCGDIEIPFLELMHSKDQTYTTIARVSVMVIEPKISRNHDSSPPPLFHGG